MVKCSDYDDPAWCENCDRIYTDPDSLLRGETRLHSLDDDGARPLCFVQVFDSSVAAVYRLVCGIRQLRARKLEEKKSSSSQRNKEYNKSTRPIQRHRSQRNANPTITGPALTSTAQSVPLPKRQPESQAAPAVSGTSQPVDPLGARKIFVGGLNRQVTSKALRTQFARYGNVTDATVIRDRKTGVSMGYGYVTFELSSVAEAVLAEPNHLVCGSYVGVKKFQKPIRGGINQDITASATSVGSKPKSSSKEVKKDPEGFAFFVGDLNMTIKEEVFSTYFSTFGTVKKVLIFPSKGSKKQRKHAFVFLEGEESVKKVFDSQPHFICGSAVCVKPDTRKKKEEKLVSQLGSLSLSKSVDVAKPASQRCPKWPKCYDPQCAYIHPTAMCADRPCPRGATCAFLHPEDAEKLVGVGGEGGRRLSQDPASMK